MAGSNFVLGSPVQATDGRCGELAREVFDPASSTLTHLVVKSSSPGELARLVPIGLVTEAGSEIRLSVNLEEFRALDAAEEFQNSYSQDFLEESRRGSGPAFPGRFLPSERFLGIANPIAPGIGLTGVAPGAVRPDAVTPPAPVREDLVPKGQVEIGPGDRVQASDGAIGHIDGVAVDADGHVTLLLLEEGHLWGKKRVVIPAEEIVAIESGEVRVKLSKKEIEALPEFDADFLRAPKG